MSSLYIFSNYSQAHVFRTQVSSVTDAHLIITGHFKNHNHIKATLSDYLWKSISYYQEPSSNTIILNYLKYLIYKFRIIRFFQKNKVNKLYISSVNNLIQLLFLHLFQHRDQIYLLNDGMQQIIVNQMRKQNKLIHRPLPLMFKYLGLKIKPIDKLTFITPYKLYSKIDQICYLPFRLSKNAVLDKSKVGVIGMPLTELRLMDKNEYLTILKKIKANFKDKELVYLPHPRESKIKLQAVSKIILIEQGDEILEKRIYKKEKFPARIVSFYSSVLLNLFLIDKRIRVHYIKPNLINNRSVQENLKSLYIFFNNVNSDRFTELKL